MTEVSIEQYHEARMAEHEVLLSFVHDKDAIAFQEWWFPVGMDAFEDWCAKQDD